MKCPRCQQDNPPQAKFCLECAAPLAPRCANCGTQLPAGAKFCFECATPVSAPGSQPRFASPETYTPKHLAERIINSKAALEGERKQVTVLFADLKGSMELLADRDPEEARKILDPILEKMMEAVHHYEGTVNQVMGDGIMALFGAPIGHEDHALRACYAALRMKRRVDLYADEIQQKGGTPVQIRVGVNSGDVVVRAIGSDLHMDYTAVGQTTHLAARMEQLAKPGSALVTHDTLKLTEGYVQVRPLGAVPVKGLETPIPVYELTGTVPTRSRLQVSAARGLTRFVGRDRELEQLGRALERAAAGHGQAVAVVGEAGVGKSRLAWEFARSHRTHGWLVVESGSVSYGKATPYLPVIDLLKAYFRIQERDEPREVRERVAGKLLMLDRALEPLLTPLLALLDVPFENASWEALDPPQRRQRTLDAIKRLLLRESQVQPLFLIFEDLHWIDAETQALLEALMESLPTARMLLLVNYRPEYRHAWGGKTYYLQLRIDPLAPESADTLLISLLGDDPTLAPLKRVLISRTEGNPFFLEESVRTLVETQALVGERGAYRMMKAPEAWQIPATAQAILAARIDRLPTEGKSLLQAASVIGKNVPFALLLAIAGVPEDDLRRGLTRLQAAEFLYETSLFPDLEYTFKHALTLEVAYGSVLQERRRTLHARIVDAIEAVYRERLTEQVDRLAHHAYQGQVWDRAVRYSRQAAARARGRSAHQQAVVCLEEALEALRHLPKVAETQSQGIDVRLELRGSLYPLGEFEKMQTYLREAQAIASAIPDARRLGLVSILTGEGLRQTGSFVEARAHAEQALALAEKLQDVPLRVYASHYFGLACHAVGDYRRASVLLRFVTQTPQPELPPDAFGGAVVGSWAALQAITLGWLARCLADRGEFEEGAAAGLQAITTAEALESPYSLAAACIGLGYNCLGRGDFDAASRVLERAWKVACDANLVLFRPQAARLLGDAYLRVGRIDEGVELVRVAADEVDARRLLMQQPAVLALLSAACLFVASLDEALTAALRALALARERGQRGEEAVALRMLGEIASDPNGPDNEMAETSYRQALTMAEDLGMRPLVAHCHLGLGKLYRRTGKREQAHEHLATATTMYREMGMTYWLEKAEAKLK